MPRRAGVEFLDLCNDGAFFLGVGGHSWRRCRWSRTVSRGNPSRQVRQLLLERRQLLVVDFRCVMHFEESSMFSFCFFTIEAKASLRPSNPF